MKIAIVDDNILFSKKLYQDIDQFIRKVFTKYEIDIINKDFMKNIVNKKYDILFLDIDLQELNGIDIGKKTLSWENNPIIIFVSSRNELVFSSLSVRPFYFVRKTSYQDDLPSMFLLLENYFKNNMTFLQLIYMVEKQIYS